MKTVTEEKKKFINEFLEEPLIARMATVDVKGQPHVVPVWYGWDGKSIWISSFSNTRKVNELKINPKISVSIDASMNGRTKAVILEGEVELVREPGDFLQKQFHWIYERYLGEKGVMEKGTPGMDP